MDRKALSFGRNQFGQLGQPELKTYEKPTLIADLEHVNVIQAACGRNHSLFLTDTGVVYACGDNKSGQCGIGNNSTQVVQKPTRINYRGPQIIKVGCGAEFSAILDIKGNLHTFGLPEYGQLGKFQSIEIFTHAIESIVISIFGSIYFSRSQHRWQIFHQFEQNVIPLWNVTKACCSLHWKVQGWTCHTNWWCSSGRFCVR